jgi:N-acetylmuramic acid 6-phosphate etherase
MLEKLTTEQRNPRSHNLDQLDATGIVRLMTSEDAGVAAAVAAESPAIARAIMLTAERLGAGGRLIYLGAGTSGRLGVLDAAECPPTFNTPPEMVRGIIAGGSAALTEAIEGAEDDPDRAAHDLAAIDFGPADLLVGIATSGRTPYVLGGLRRATQVGAATIGLTCNADSEMHGLARIVIAPVVGPEIISGSTRLKAGTATKMVLNMLTTGAMILLGKTYGNLMVDLKATNQKLKARSVRIVREITDLSSDEAERLLASCQGEVKTAIVAHLKQVEPAEARRRLAAADQHLRAALCP